MNIPIEILALILLLIHSGSVVYMINVIRKQWALMKLPPDVSVLIDPTSEQIEEVKYFRRVLFVLSLVILIGNLIPIFVDLATIIFNNPTGRPDHVKIISLMYALSNALTELISAYLINLLYRLSLVAESDTIKASKKRKKGTK